MNYDLNGNGRIDLDEYEIVLEDRRRAMEDADAKRDAKLMADIASVYVIGASGVAAAYFGFNAMESKNDSTSR